MAEPARIRILPGGREAQEPLWREALGWRLRSLRQERGEKLTETASRAGVSPQYLSEVERGRKDPSSEMIAALAGALGLTLIELTEQVAGELRFARALNQTSPSRASLARAPLAQVPRRQAGPQALLGLAA